MKIYGLGVDVTDINRIKKNIKNKNFILRIFSKKEIKKCSSQLNRASCYAKRFAAKEAFSKALGIGISRGINFKEIIIENMTNGKPFLKLTGKTRLITNKIFKSKKYKILLSLSDEKSIAIATVIISL